MAFDNQVVFNFLEAVGSVDSRECRWVYILESIYVYVFVIMGIDEEV